MKHSRKHYKGGDFTTTPTTTPVPETPTPTTVAQTPTPTMEQKSTGFFDSIKEYASNIKNKASDYMNKTTTGGKGTKVPLLLSKTKKLRKPTKKSKSMKKKSHKRKTHYKRK